MLYMYSIQSQKLIHMYKHTHVDKIKSLLYTDRLTQLRSIPPPNDAYTYIHTHLMIDRVYEILSTHCLRCLSSSARKYHTGVLPSFIYHDDDDDDEINHAFIISTIMPKVCIS